MNNHITQLELEEQTIRTSAEAYDKKILESRFRGDETTLNAVQRLLKASIEPTSEAIVSWMKEAKEGPGRHHVALQWVECVKPEVLAVIALKGVLNNLTSAPTASRVGKALACMVEDEIRLQQFKQEQGGWYDLMVKKNKKATSYRHKRNSMLHTGKKSGVGFITIPEGEREHLGMLLLDLVAAATGLVEIKPEYHRKKTIMTVVPTEKTTQWLDKSHEFLRLARPQKLPMIEAPRPWTSFHDGGYHHPVMCARTKLVKANPKLDHMYTQDKMPQVYAAVNNIQSVGWKVNQFVLDVAEQVWAQGIPVGKLPEKYDSPVPAFPFPDSEGAERTQEQKDAIRVWAKKSEAVHKKNAASRGQRLAADRLLSVAREFASYETIWFPHNMDFRGRIYAMPEYLSPQGSDLSKAMLLFAEGKPVGSSWDWLAIHVANCFGVDKVSFKERIQWVHENEQAIVDTANSPMETLSWWAEADSPWQFLAAAREWANFLALGEDYVCHLPVGLDGSCNGIQHFSAMMRDPIGGAAVNLVPSEAPGDVYNDVAVVVKRKLQQMALGFDSNAALAEEWLESGLVTRKLTKRPVMVLPYGGTQFSCKDFCYKAMLEAVDGFEENLPFSVTVREAANFIGDIVWEAIGEVVCEPQLAMRALQDRAEELAMDNQALTWAVPTGFTVVMDNRVQLEKRIQTQLLGKVYKPVKYEDTPNIDKKAQVNGVAPNFVHSCDAAHLVMTANQLREAGVTTQAFVHDSFGFLPADIPVASRILREAFVELHQHDLLSLAGVSLPKGTLDLMDVLDSDYFFA